MISLKDIPKIDCEYLIYFNLLQAGERSSEIKSFRRHVQYALFLVSGKMGENEWIIKATEEVNEMLKKMGTSDTDEDYEFLLYAGLSMKIIEKMVDKRMIKMDALEEGVLV